MISLIYYQNLIQSKTHLNCKLNVFVILNMGYVLAIVRAAVGRKSSTRFSRIIIWSSIETVIIFRAITISVAAIQSFCRCGSSPLDSFKILVYYEYLNMNLYSNRSPIFQSSTFLHSMATTIVPLIFQLNSLQKLLSVLNLKFALLQKVLSIHR
jgi:hypothetical protein